MTRMTIELDPKQIPDEVLLQPADLARGTRAAIDQLVGFVQENDGFTYTAYQARIFDFFAYGFKFSGSYRYEEVSAGSDIETISITRTGEGILDQSVVKLSPTAKRKPLLIAYSDLTTGETMPNNSYGALKRTLAITQPPTL